MANVEQKRQEVERSIKGLAGELATKLTDVANQGTASAYFSTSAILGEQGLALDQLAAAWGLLDGVELAETPQVETAKASGPMVKVQRVWAEIGEEMATWARERKFDEVAFAIDVFDQELALGDFKAAEVALDQILDAMGDLVAREFVRKYTAKMRYVKSLFDR